MVQDFVHPQYGQVNRMGWCGFVLDLSAFPPDDWFRSSIWLAHVSRMVAGLDWFVWFEPLVREGKWETAPGTPTSKPPMQKPPIQIRRKLSVCHRFLFDPTLCKVNKAARCPAYLNQFCSANALNRHP